MSEPRIAAGRGLCWAIWNGCRCARPPHPDDRHVWMNMLDGGRAVDPASYPDEARAAYEYCDMTHQGGTTHFHPARVAGVIKAWQAAAESEVKP